MHSVLSRRRLISVRGFRTGSLVCAAALLLPTVLLADTPESRSFIRVDRAVARSWGLHRIAVIQAAQGDITGALNTIASIDDLDVVRGAGDVTGVCFCEGMPLYDHPPAPGNANLFTGPGSQVFPGRNHVPDRVPATVPQGLPADYLAADPRHGAVVNFSDECDSYGTRVTSRRYADGYVVIDTPRSAK
jgi:hypothetical protein